MKLTDRQREALSQLAAVPSGKLLVRTPKERHVGPCVRVNFNCATKLHDLGLAVLSAEQGVGYFLEVTQAGVDSLA